MFGIIVFNSFCRCEPVTPPLAPAPCVRSRRGCGVGGGMLFFTEFHTTWFCISCTFVGIYGARYFKFIWTKRTKWRNQSKKERWSCYYYFPPKNLRWHSQPIDLFPFFVHENYCTSYGISIWSSNWARHMSVFLWYMNTILPFPFDKTCTHNKFRVNIENTFIPRDR